MCLVLFCLFFFFVKSICTTLMPFKPPGCRTSLVVTPHPTLHGPQCSPAPIPSFLPQEQVLQSFK